MTHALYSVAPPPDLVACEACTFVEVASTTDVAPYEIDRPRHWLPGAGPLPSDFFMPLLA